MRMKQAVNINDLNTPIFFRNVTISEVANNLKTAEKTTFSAKVWRMLAALIISLENQSVVIQMARWLQSVVSMRIWQ